MKTVIVYASVHHGNTKKLVEKIAEQVMQYREDMLANNDSFDGCAGLEEVNSFTEWIDFENRLKQKYMDIS